VAARFLYGDQPPGAREEARDLTTPINKPRGISREVIKEHGETKKGPDVTKPKRDDLRPKDVFSPKPKNMAVYNYVSEGWPGVSDDYRGMERAIDKQIPKDKGYKTVSNLSQYLVETEGGGGTPPVE